MTVLDASAVLAFLQGEPGAELVEQELFRGESVCGAANWSEVAQKVLQRGADWHIARSLLFSYGLRVESVNDLDAERGAELWARAPILSLGDRLCLALADRLEDSVLTSDSAWGGSGRIRQIRPEPDPPPERTHHE